VSCALVAVAGSGNCSAEFNIYFWSLGPATAKEPQSPFHNVMEIQTIELDPVIGSYVDEWVNLRERS